MSYQTRNRQNKRFRGISSAALGPLFFLFIHALTNLNHNLKNKFKWFSSPYFKQVLLDVRYNSLNIIFFIHNF